MTTEKEISDTAEVKSSPLSGAAAFFYGRSREGGIPVLLAFLLGPPKTYSDGKTFSVYFGVSLLVAACAVGLRWWSFGFEKEKHFVMNGPYRYVRNPVELSALFAYTSAGVFLGIPTVYLLLVMIGVVLYLSFVSIHYEKVLVQKFGWKYVRYRERVKRWIPSSLPSTNPEKQDFSIGRAFVYDKKGFAWVLLLLVVAGVRVRFPMPWWQ